MAIARSVHSIVIAIASTLVLVPTALAMPIRDAVGNPSDADVSSPIVVTRPAGFSWTDAAVGVGLALSLCALVLAIIIVLRRDTSTVRRAR